ncbi:dolichol kinase EVAN-like isoform X3 [Prunus yedoensis var. nudiflora]|uniref:Dolichol kinase EVAN-like isoform X3 n=1 Tax=Prunus yedoensis var. nudiflora TaxID=2094558 RepID=A0A314XZV1_PRUYE|nr:dolichol kinase EVAN-like isoform X3 [Prunus yedoensis var. nudiflora]
MKARQVLRVLRWSKTGKKTIEETAAGITPVLAACSVLILLLAFTGYILTQIFEVIWLKLIWKQNFLHKI